MLRNILSCDMRFPTMWYVQPAKPQISLRICAVWLEPLLVAWMLYECKATDWTSFGVSKPKRRLHRPVKMPHCWKSCVTALLLTLLLRSFKDRYNQASSKLAITHLKSRHRKTIVSAFKKKPQSIFSNTNLFDKLWTFPLLASRRG